MKRRTLFLIVTLLFVIFVSSCTTTHYYSRQQEYSEQYVGLTHHQIVNNIGAPNRQVSDGGGGTILIYERYLLYNHILHCYINSSGICYKIYTNEIKAVEEEMTPDEKRQAFLGWSVLIGLSLLVCLGLSYASK